MKFDLGTETQEISEMSLVDIDIALETIKQRVKSLYVQRDALLNRKALLNAELYVVVSIDGEDTLYGVTEKHEVRTPQFKLRLLGSRVTIILEREDKILSFHCFVDHPMTFSESSAHEDGGDEKEHSFSFDVFQNLESAADFMKMNHVKRS